MRFGLAWGGLVLVAMVGGCTSDAAGPSWNGASAGPSAVSGSAPPFTEPGSYSYVLVRGCDAAAPLGRYRATVQNGAVTGSERLDAAPRGSAAASDVDLGPITGKDGEEIEVPTLGELIQIAQTAADDGGEVTTTYDAKDGHPVKVVVNVSDDGPSGAECFAVTDYRAA